MFKHNRILYFIFIFLVGFITNAYSVTYKDIEIVDIPFDERENSRSNTRSKRIIIQQNVIVNNDSYGFQSDRCNTPGAPSRPLYFGKEETIIASPNQTEYWFCVTSPYSGIDIGVNAKGHPAKVGIKLYKDTFERVKYNGSSYSGNISTKHFGGPSDVRYKINPGSYIVKFLVKTKSKIPVKFLLNQAETYHYIGPW